jgi:N-acetylglucosaminyl-diphospho-decaprenol L-rhamnosyltransferase
MLERCVRSLEAHAPECETIVVDNHSSDKSLEFAPGLEGRIRIVVNQENTGFAAANNTGWRLSSGRHVLFLNPDTECRAGSIQWLETTMESNPKAWAVGGALTDPVDKIQSGFNVRRFPTIGSVAADVLFLDEVWPKNPWTRNYRMSDWGHDSVREVDQPAAACLMLRREALVETGGFDERFFPAWFEDVDLCRRIRNAGGIILYQPAARFLHHGGSSLAGRPRQEFLEFFHTNMLRYFSKHYGPEKERQVRYLLVTGMRLRAVLSLGLPHTGERRKVETARMYWETARRLSFASRVRS